MRRWESGRFGMLETIREFALEELEAGGERKAVSRAHLEHFLNVAEGPDVTGEQSGWLDQLDAERDNFRAAMRWALDNDHAGSALQLASALGRFWVIRAHAEGYAWLSEALDAAPDAPPSARGNGLLWAGSTVSFTSDHTRAQGLFEEALALFREAGDQHQVAAVLDRLAAAGEARGDFETARAMADESVSIFRSIGDEASVIYPLGKVARDERRRGNRARGRALEEEALALSRQVGDSWFEAMALAELAEASAEDGDQAGAGALARQAVSLGHEIGNGPTLAYCFALLAQLAAADGAHERAGALWGALEALEERGEAFVDSTERAEFERKVIAEPSPGFETGRRQGRALTVDEAVALALDGA